MDSGKEVVKPLIGVESGAVEPMLEALFGNRTAGPLMLYLLHYGEVYPTGAARDLGLTQSAVQRQLEKLEAAGLLVSRLVGRTRVYTFNPKQPVARKLEELVEVCYEALPASERQRLFGKRRRPRRKGKPVRGQ